MKTDRRQRFEIAFYSTLAALLGASVGYWWAMSAAAEHVREIGR